MNINKVQVFVFCPTIDMKFDIMIPIDKKINSIKKLIIKGIKELYSESFELVNEELYNKDNGQVYNNNKILKDTDVRNGTRLIFI